MNEEHLRRVRVPPGLFELGVFAALDPDTWRSGLPPPEGVARRTTLAREGEDADDVLLVASGLVKSYRAPTPRRRQIVAFAGPGDVIGAESLARRPWGTTWETVTRCTLFRIPSARFERLVADHPRLALALIRAADDESRRLRSLLVDLGTKRAGARVASCILLFQDRQAGARRREPFNLPISRQEMGAMLGLSPETVSRQLRRLVDARVIRVDHRRMTVLDSRRLRALAERRG